MVDTKKRELVTTKQWLTFKWFCHWMKLRFGIELDEAQETWIFLRERAEVGQWGSDEQTEEEVLLICVLK